ncbi:LysR family transcriptional regulator [Bradyrhizobium huanghuaihaiense]|uniref:LysR family transcriptional regulator n=1 Tax=Bradyrhizobium huanghuaihaiense TaxID=990078 RepID=UPI0021AAA126|nr:LysR family transcriptional regulator [Bradyrhizobium sp. CB3035]UWU73514.1 LysR family transcriptional regulator [Bradyrhizobium sp. CB3035]
MSGTVRDNLDGVAVFVEAVHAGGFARAAERLALTRSAVGKTIARMEARLGVRLFHRTTRSQSLTEDGQIYYEHCLRALEDLRAGAAIIESGRHEVSGRLKISMPLLFGRYRAEPILLELAAQHPKLELDLRFSDHLVDLVGEGFDLVIRNHAPGAGSALHVKKIASQRRVVCATPDYLATHGRPIDPASLVEHEALVYWHKDHVFPWTFRDADGRQIEPQLRWRLQFDSHEAIMAAALKNMGVACLLDWMVRDHFEAKRLVPLLEDFASPPVETYAVWPAAKFIPPRLRVTIDALEKLRSAR